MLVEEYPKEGSLKSGQRVVLRPMTVGDRDRLLEFFLNLPLEDRLFLKDDVTNPKVIENWTTRLDYEQTLPILALTDNRIIGDATLHRDRFGWSRHVGEVRIVTDRSLRRRGLGRLLAREIFLLAQRQGILKVIAQMMEDQRGAIKVFESLGFEREAVLRDHVIDQKGKKHNLVVMSQDIERLWQKMQDWIRDVEIRGD